MDENVNAALCGTEQAFYERAVGAAILEYVKQISPQNMRQKADSSALQLVKEIRMILDDDSLEDSECFQKIEAIVVAFRSQGLTTSRHDFG